MKICGIYCIIGIMGYKIYIGQSNDIGKRWMAHIRLLRKKDHHNIKLQNYYNKYGEKTLYCQIIKKTSIEKLGFYEKFFINFFDSITNRLNITEGGETPPIKTRKPFVLKNADTGEEVSGKSIKDFCQKYGEYESNICAVLNGRQKHSGPWYDPTKTWKPKYYTLQSPNGVFYHFWKIKEFCKSVGFEERGFQCLMSRRSDFYKGWSRLDSDPLRKSKASSKSVFKRQFRLINPFGEIIEGTNLRQFAIKNNLNYIKLHSLMNGKRKTYKNWTI